MTNGDRIRSLTDKELAHKLCSIYKNCTDCVAYFSCNPDDVASNGLIKWLGQEEEDADTTP